MDPGGTYCLPQDPDFWEAMQNQYKDKTATLLAKEKELRQKIADMELMLANNEKRGHPFRSSSPSNTVPKVFPQMSDCIVENVPKIIRDTSPVSSVLPQIPQSAMISSLTKRDHYPTNFFQKVMENAKSILTMRCNVVQPTNPIDEKPTKDPDLKCKCTVGDPQRLSNKADFGGSSTCDEATKTDATTDNCSQEVNTSYSCSLSSCKNMQYTQSADTMTDTKKDNSSFINSCTCGATNLISSAPAGRDVSDSVCQCCNPECGKEKDKDQNTDAPTVSARKISCQCQHSSRSKSKKTGSGDSSKKRCNNETCPVIASRSAPDMAGNKPDVDLAQNKNGIKINENNEFPSPEYPVNTPNATVVPGRESSKDNSCPCSLKTITDLAAKEKQIKSQIQELQQREKSYDNLMDSFRNMASKTTCTCCTIIQGPNGDFDKISKELKVENKLLRSELEEMKMELKHCLEKIQGPMKQKLEAEKSKCVVLEGELNKAAQNMVINHDTHTREMNSLKLQLCTACNNISELNSMNRRLKDEMDSLDCMCAKLEEDLMKQKINEAETIKRLTRRRPEFEETNGGRAIQGGFRCDSNLDVIARKLSSTLKESEPCDQCAKLPPELTSAARCIRDLTDMVQQRKKEVEAVMGKTRDSYSQSPRTEDVGIQCKCLDEDTKATKTLYDVPSSFPEKDSSQYGKIGTKATSAVNTPSGVGSAYYSAEGEPLEPREEVKEETIIARQAYTVGPEQPEVATVATGASQQMPRAPVKLDDDDVCKEPCGDTAPCSKGKPCFELITSGILETEAAPAMAVKDEPTREMQIKTEEVKGEYQSSSMSKPSEEVSAIPLDIESQASKIGAEGGVESETASKGSRIPSAIAGDDTTGTGAAESSLGVPSQISGAPGEEAQGVVSKGVSPFVISGRIGAEGEISAMGTPIADGAIAVDISEGRIEVAARSAIDGPLTTSAIAEGLGGGTIPPGLGGKIGVQGSMALGAPSTSPGYGAVAGATGGIPFKEERTGNFPFEVETRAEFLQEPPPDLQVTTTITASGTLEVITEAAGGIIETTLTYKEDGTLEVLTQLTEETKTRPATIDYATPEISKAMKVPEEVVMGIQESIISGGETDLSGGLGTVSEHSRDTTIISSVSEIDKTSAMAGTGKIYDTGETETIEKQEISEETEIPSSPVDETEEIPAEEVEEIEVAEEVEAAPIEEIETPAEEVEIPVEEVETDAAVEADEEVEEEAVEAEGILFEETVEEVAEEVEASPEEEAAEEAPEEEDVEEAPEEEKVVEVAPEEEAVEEAPEDAAEEEAAPVEEGEVVEEAVEESPEEGEATEEAVVESPEEGEPKPRGKDVCLCPDKPTEEEEPEPKEEVVKEEADESEAIEEPAEEVAEETVEEAAEEMAEEATKETVEEPAEEMVEEPAEEATEEAAEEAAEEEVKIAEEESTPEPAEEGEPKRIGRDVCICPNRPPEGGEPEPKEEDELVESPEGEPTEEGDEGEKAIAEGEPTSEPTEEGEAAVEGEIMLEGTGEEDQAAEPAEGEEETAEPVEGEAVAEDKAVEEIVPNEEDIDECHKVVEDIVSDAAKEGEEEAVAVSQKRDYSCQSTAAVEQSCQCCECKNVGVSTTQDSETATEEIMVQSEQTSQIETIKEEAEAEADPDLLTGGDTGDIAEAVSLEAGKVQGTTDEVSTINEEDTTDAPDVKASTPSADGDASEYTTAQEKSECTAPCAVSEVAVIEPPVEVITQEESECTAPCAVSEVAVVEPPAEVIIQEKSEAAVLEPPIEVKVQTPLAPVPKPSDIKEVKMKASVPKSSHIRGKCSTFITEESLEPCQDAAIQCDCAGEIEIDDHSEGRVSSGSDTEQESVKGKVSKLEAVKKMGSSEVPESVSKLSAGTSKTPSLGSTSSRKPRKKRSSRLENIRCDCPGVCQCVVCAPEVIAKRKALTGSPLPPTGQAGKLCCCLPQPQPQMQAFQNMSQPPIQMNQAYVQSQMPDPAYPHPLGCACAVCICSCTPGPRFGNTRTTIDDVFGRQVNAPLNYQHPPNYGLNSHPPNCECIDCLCMPTIKQLANLREMPVIKDEKQVYQVKCVCPKKPSKIPIPTNSPLGPPKAKTTIDCTCEKCACTPCLSKQAGSQDEKPPGSELASLCDCKDCQCTVCFNKPPKKDDKPSSKGCCCKGDCTCDSCPIDKLKTAVEAAAPKRGPGHPEDCDCLECTCPRSPAMMGSGQSAAPAPAPTAKKQPPAGCDCVECACPGMAGDDLPVPPGCDCSVCVCPGRDTAVGDSKRNIAECDCNPCECNPCADPKRRPEDLTISPCDCPECKCEPCADPSKSGTKGGTKGHPATCDCPECVCEGQRCLQTDIGVGSKENKATHTPDCICEECLCDTEQHETGCTCPECQCVDCIYKKENKQISASECQCGDCTCIDCPKKQNMPQKQGDGQGGCTCSVCECTDCIYKKDQASEECKCGDCKCIDCPKKHKDDAGAHGDDCTCTDCFLKKTNPADEECKCGDCLCVDCPKKHSGGDDSKKGAVGSGPCSCIVCACDVCSDPNKKKSGGGGGASKDGGCSCGDCKCVDCIHKKSDGKKQDAGKDCTCDTCQCTDCTGKKGSGGDGGKDGCTCGDCKCVDCIHKKSSGGQKQDTPPAGGKEVGKGCTCATCLCVDCAGKKVGGGGGGGSGSSGGAGGASSGGDGGKTAGCTCKDCKCPDCIYKKSGDKKSGGAVFTDPPPFTVPIKEPCKCAKCECIVCASKGAGSAGGGSSGDQCTCDRPKSSKEGGTAKGGSSDGSPPPFQELVRQPCTCQKCDCVSCQKGGGSKSSGEGSKSSGGGATVDPPRFQELVREQCTCKKCDCVSCNKGGGSAQSGGDAKSDQCTCKKCVCSPCTKKGGSSEKGGSSAEAPPFEVPIRQPCKCTKCDCVSCNKSYVPSKSAAASATVMQCDCATCTCADEILKGKPLSNKTSKANAGDGCTCPNCVCDDCPKDQGHKTKSSKGKEVNISRSSKHEKGDLKTRSSNHICPSKDSIQNVSRMGNVELMAKIKRDTKANCECREQIKELKRALDKIKCACTEAEVKASKNKPFVKQASAFGQTMSGLKVALANLQEKCKAKDKMIEVMTDELKLRTSSNTVHKVMNTKRCADALDYDKAEDVQTVDSVSTNVLYAVGEEREIGHTKVRPKSSDCNASCKGVETEKTRKGKKKLKSHKGRETNIDLAGFEVVDIRRITQDSIIIKWKPPKSSLVTGYDIFINGVNKSKVMSGGRTSAMIHSLDLSATIQITIYAVTKCGRCEPPAIAIYEINC